MTYDPRSSQLSLNFGPRPTSLLPDETIYSFCSRDHQLVGSFTHEMTSQHHFGTSKQAGFEFIPRGIDHFVARNPSLGLSSNDVIHRHTLASFYLPFLQQHKVANALSQIKFGNGQGVVMQLMLESTPNAIRAQLKQCYQCVTEDVEKFSTPYWHMVHQLPSVWICPIHQSALYTSSFVRPRKWQLPRRGSQKQHFQLNSTLTKLVNFSTELMRQELGFSFCHSSLKSTYITALKSETRGVRIGAASSMMSWGAIGRQFADHLHELRHVPSLHGLPDCPDAAARLVAKTLKSNWSKGHPIINLSLMTWLFPSFKSFMESYLAEVDAFQGQQRLSEWGPEIALKRSSAIT